MALDYIKIKFRAGLDFLLYLLATKGIIITANDRKLADLKDIHKGQRCFIIGNGPSLQIKDLDRLKNEITFASNKIYLAFDQTDWRPTYYSAEDRIFLQNYHEVVGNLAGFTKLFPKTYDNLIPPIKDGIYYRFLFTGRKNFYPNGPGFGLSPLLCFHWGHTVTYTLLQFACYMGIREIYIIGVDMDYKVPKGFERGFGTYIANSNTNHFHPDYLKPGEIARSPNEHLQLLAYEDARKKAIELGCNIYNATRGGKLEIFPRVDFDSLFEN